MDPIDFTYTIRGTFNEATREQVIQFLVELNGAVGMCLEVNSPEGSTTTEVEVGATLHELDGPEEELDLV